MYDLIDQPVARLSLSGRLLLWSMRAWVHSAGTGTCPPAAIAPVLAQHGALAGLPHLHGFLTALNRGAGRAVLFAPAACRRVHDDEAVLLALFRNAATAPAVAWQTLALLLDDAEVEDSFISLIALAGVFEEARLGPIGLLLSAADRR